MSDCERVSPPDGTDWCIAHNFPMNYCKKTPCEYCGLYDNHSNACHDARPKRERDAVLGVLKEILTIGVTPVTAQKAHAAIEKIEGKPFVVKRLEPAPLGNTCNRHVDCREADELARAKGFSGSEHCHDEGCKDCFGD
jgi:hypothetical protein